MTDQPTTRKVLRWEHYATIDEGTKQITVSTANMLADVATLYKSSHRTRGDFLNDAVAAWEIAATIQPETQKP
jgi:hypothetical protein